MCKMNEGNGEEEEGEERYMTKKKQMIKSESKRIKEYTQGPVPKSHS